MGDGVSLHLEHLVMDKALDAMPLGHRLRASLPKRPPRQRCRIKGLSTRMGYDRTLVVCCEGKAQNDGRGGMSIAAFLVCIHLLLHG